MSRTPRHAMRLADVLAYLVPGHPAVDRLGLIGELAKIKPAQLQQAAVSFVPLLRVNPDLQPVEF